MNTKQLLEIIEILHKEYPDAKCSLDWSTPLELLIATQLSAQCTDARVNMVTPALFARFKDAKAYASAPIEEIEHYIMTTGLYRNKAKNIKACCEKIVSDFGGEVPDTLEDLVSLPGTGRKTANLVLGELYGKPAYVVDTHVTRLSGLIGITKETEPGKIEKDLRRLLPPDSEYGKYSLLLSHLLVHHGRRICVARRPECSACAIKDKCKYGKKI